MSTPSDPHKRISKYLSLILRHDPDRGHIVLDSHGWTDIDLLLAGMKKNGQVISIKELQETVDNNAKKRFQLKDGRIRAVQGHSVPVAVDMYQPSQPPQLLYHGTRGAIAPVIAQHGIKAMSRQWVHLSHDVDSAQIVGRRRDPNPVILVIEAAKMWRAGHLFYCAENGVWLTKFVPAEFVDNKV